MRIRLIDMFIERPPVENSASCPILKTHRRLAQAHVLWHQALNSYLNPPVFLANLNATIESLRNVTFVLQNEKRAFTNFDEWYGPWQARLKEDKISRWLHEARTTVVHQGDLANRSTAEVKLVTHSNEIIANLVVPINMVSEKILEHRDVSKFLSEYQQNEIKDQAAVIAVERIWRTEGLDNLEVLEGLARVYGLLSEMVLDAHIHLKGLACISSNESHTDFCSRHHRTGVLPCMLDARDLRTELYKLSTGEMLTAVEAALPPATAAEDDKHFKRYGNGVVFADWEKLDPIHFAEKVLDQAKKVLRRDKHHERLMFMRDGKGNWTINQLIAHDRSEKHLLMQSIARTVESRGVDAIIEVGEMWTAPIGAIRGLKLESLEGAPERGELLFVMVLTREGIMRSYHTQFTRGPFGGIKVGDTKQTEGMYRPDCKPIVEVWKRQGAVKLPGGKSLPRLWQPDPLDICFCGGPKRFGECCQPLVETKSIDAREEIIAQVSSGNVIRAEAHARATVAQYVIWIKQHTVMTMHVAQDLYRQLEGIDTRALESNILFMWRVLKASGTTETYLSQLRNLSIVVGLPKLSMRLVAMAAQWLRDQGQIEEAILELDGVGQPETLDLTKVDDFLSLLTMADICGLAPDRTEALIRRSIEVAVDEDEKLMGTFALVDHLSGEGKREDALECLDQIDKDLLSASHLQAARVHAVLLRWRLTQSAADYMAFRKVISEASPQVRANSVAFLLDQEQYPTVLDVLGADTNDPIAQVLVAMANFRLGKNSEALGIFSKIPRDRVPSEYTWYLAKLAGLLAVTTGDSAIRDIATKLISELPPKSIDEELKRLVIDLRLNPKPLKTDDDALHLRGKHQAHLE
jgi:hypothetical protein